MTTDLETRMRLLEDREHIKELRATYCFLVDDGRSEALVETCFTPDAVCDFRAVKGGPVFRSRGREEIRHFFAEILSGMLRDMRHTVHNHRIAVDGDAASGDCYFELTAIDCVSEEAVVGTGRYVDRYRRVDGAWRFAERRAEIFFISPLPDGWAARHLPRGFDGRG